MNAVRSGCSLHTKIISMPAMPAGESPDTCANSGTDQSMVDVLPTQQRQTARLCEGRHRPQTLHDSTCVSMQLHTMCVSTRATRVVVDMVHTPCNMPYGEENPSSTKLRARLGVGQSDLAPQCIMCSTPGCVEGEHYLSLHTLEPTLLCKCGADTLRAVAKSRGVAQHAHREKSI